MMERGGEGRPEHDIQILVRPAPKLASDFAERDEHEGELEAVVQEEVQNQEGAQDLEDKNRPAHVRPGPAA